MSVAGTGLLLCTPGNKLSLASHQSRVAGLALGVSPIVQGWEHWSGEGKQEVFFLAPGPAPGGMKDVKIVCLVIVFPFQPLIISLSVEGMDSVNAEAFWLFNC